jgi:hypothetical protein
MAITVYSELQQSIKDWLNRADLDAKVPDFITLAEATLNKVIRSNRMVNTAPLSFAGGAQNAAIPNDCLEAIYVQGATPDLAMEQVSVQQLIMLRRNRLRASGTPRFYALIGRNIEVSPPPVTGVTLNLTYYQQIPALSTASTNWLLTYQPDVYLYTALYHAMPYLQDDQRTQVLESMVMKMVSAAVTQNTRITFDDQRTPGFSLDSPSDGVGGAGVATAGGA